MFKTIAALGLMVLLSACSFDVLERVREVMEAGGEKAAEDRRRRGR